MKVNLRNKYLSTVACLVIAILLLSNLSTAVMAESDLTFCTDDDTGSLGSVDETDLIYYTVLGTGSATAGGIIGAITYMEVFNKLLNAQALGGVGVLARLGPASLSAGAGILAGVCVAAAIFGIGYGIYYAVNG